MSTPQMVQPVLDRILVELGVLLVDTRGGRPQHVRLTPGTEVVASIASDSETGVITSDECCEGIAGVVVEKIEPNDQEVTATEGGVSYWRVHLRVAVLRCASVGIDLVPTDAELAEDARREISDFEALRALPAILLANGVVLDYAMGEWEPVGPDGGCHGGALKMILDVDCA